MNAYAVIMAGGSGERFWPLSRSKRPKQLLALTSQRMMIEEAIERIAPIIPLERVLIITSAVLQQPIIDALPLLPPQNVIAEPAKRNTAPCLALACSVIESREGGDALMAVLTADHFIGNVDAFRHDVQVALDYAKGHDALLTLGIPPTRPETGYGYIRMTSAAAPSTVTSVAEFKEKPTINVAMQYLRSGEYVWNSGMFFWRTHALSSAMNASLPEVGSLINDMTSAISAEDSAALTSTFSKMPDISIDYGVMERATNVFVVPASFPWDDVGSWDSLDRMQPRDDQGNVLQGPSTVVDTNNSVIVNAHDGSHIVTGVGLDDIVVVVTNDATMVCAKERAQDVKLIVKTLREQGRSDVL
ncbi:MAG: mannose-1-phosphate guanylyltransferase [Candidatus Kapaibacterium sp.]